MREAVRLHLEMRIHLYSVHGLFRKDNLEIGRDSDNGGQTVYVMELGEALSRSPNIEKVHLFTRQVEDDAVDFDYSVPIEEVNEKFDIRRVPCGGPSYILKEKLWPHLDEFISNAIQHIKAHNIFPDWIHSHYADAGYVAAELSAFLNVPFAHSAHSLGKRKLKRMLQSGMTRAEALQRYQFVRRFEAEELTLGNAEFLVTSTDREIQFFDAYENSRLAEFHSLPPGIDFDRFYPFYEDLLPNAEKPEEDKQAMFSVQERMERFLSDPQKPLVLTICRPNRTKNIAGLIEAYGNDQELQAMANLAVFAGIRADIDAMNPGEREVLTEILLLMDKFNLYGKLAIPKKHDIDIEVPEIYRLAARLKGVFVNISMAEQFGLTLLEASACGLPVVATKNGGPAEILPKCENGFLVDPFDQDGIRRSIKELLVDQDLWQKCSNAGAANVRRHFSWDAHVENYLELVQSHLDASEGSGLKVLTRVPKIHRRLKIGRAMLASDIDGTLLHETDDSQPGLDALREVIEKREESFVFAVATGRSFQLVQDAVKKHSLPEPDLVISSVGSEIYYGLKRDLIDKAWESHISYNWDRDEIEHRVLKIRGLELQEENAQRRFKISFYNHRKNFTEDEIYDMLGDHAGNVRVIISHQTLVDLLPRRASKGRAIRYLCQQWDIPLNQTIVCGDSGNDIDMFQTSALGVVVGNAEESLAHQLRDTRDIFFAKKESAEAILEGLEHFQFPPS